MQLTQVMAKAIHEPTFRTRLMDAPKVVLAEMNIPIPQAQNVTVLESKAGEILFVLPDITEQEAEQLMTSVNPVQKQRSVRSQILLKAKKDPAYKAQLKKEPKLVLIAEGLPIPDSATVTLLENSPDQLYLVLPHIQAHRH